MSVLCVGLFCLVWRRPSYVGGVYAKFAGAVFQDTPVGVGDAVRFWGTILCIDRWFSWGEVDGAGYEVLCQVDGA